VARLFHDTTSDSTVAQKARQEPRPPNDVARMKGYDARSRVTQNFWKIWAIGLNSDLTELTGRDPSLMQRALARCVRGDQVEARNVLRRNLAGAEICEPRRRLPRVRRDYPRGTLTRIRQGSLSRALTACQSPQYSPCRLLRQGSKGTPSVCAVGVFYCAVKVYHALPRSRKPGPGARRR
jgi:hypothetical protein